MRSKVYDEEAAKREELQKIANDKELQGKTKAGTGLEEFIETGIRSAVMGIKVTITDSMIAKIIDCRDNGMFFVGTDKTIKKSEWAPRIHKSLFKGREFDKIEHLKNEHKFLPKLMIMCFMPREGGTNYMSWDHKHFLLFLLDKFPINLPAYIFNHLCTLIREGIKGRRNVPYTVIQD